MSSPSIRAGTARKYGFYRKSDAGEKPDGNAGGFVEIVPALQPQDCRS